MQNYQHETTKKMYDKMIEEVFTQLNDQSGQGLLQMSESEIHQLYNLWKKRLFELQNSIKQENKQSTKEEDNSFQKPNSRQKQQLENYEDHVHKKIKVDETPELKIEMPDINDGEILQLTFLEQPRLENEKQKDDLPNQLFYNQEQQFKPKETSRNKTIFDKVRELQRINQLQLLESEQEDSEEAQFPKGTSRFKLNIYAQKADRQDFTLNRIKPNKQQKANLDCVLFKEGCNDHYYPSINLNFNFKTEKKQKQ